MSGTTATELLDLWDQTGGLPHAVRAILYAQVAEPGLRTTDIRAFPIGRRDLAVARFRGMTFGRGLAATVDCPRCGEVMELDVDVAALIPDETNVPPTIELDHEGRRVVCRTPSTVDLLATQAGGGGARELAARCLEPPIDPLDMPDGLLGAIEERLAEADPFADIRLDLTCGGCGAVWAAPFDVVSVLDRELDAWARATLQDVAALARAFGWTERDVLELSAARRRRYLELATS